MEPRVIILRGPSGCGKTTARMRFFPKATVIDRKQIRGMFWGGALPPAQEHKVVRTETMLLRAALQRGEDVVLDGHNIDQLEATRWANEAHLAGVEFTEVNFYDEGMDYVYVDRAYPDVPEEVVLDQCRRAKNMQPIEPEVPLMRPLVQSSWLEPRFIVDMSVPDKVRPAFEGLPGVVFVSRLPTSEIKDLLAVLKNRGLWDDSTSELYMLDSKNTYDDCVKKSNLLDELAVKYNILGVFDSQEAALVMWGSRGVTTFNTRQWGE